MKHLKKYMIYENTKQEEAKRYVELAIRRAMELNNKETVDSIIQKYEKLIDFHKLFVDICKNKYKDHADYILKKLYNSTDYLQIFEEKINNKEYEEVEYLRSYADAFIETLDKYKYYEIVKDFHQSDKKMYNIVAKNSNAYSTSSSFYFKVNRRRNLTYHINNLKEREKEYREDNYYEGDGVPFVLMKYLIEEGEWNVGDTEELKEIDEKIQTIKNLIEERKKEIEITSNDLSKLIQMQLELETNQEDNIDKIDAIKDQITEIEDKLIDLKELGSNSLEDLLESLEELEEERKEYEGDDVYKLHEIGGPGYDIRRFEYGDIDTKDYSDRTSYIIGTDDNMSSLAYDMAIDMIEGDPEVYINEYNIDTEKFISDILIEEESYIENDIRDNPVYYLDEDDKELSGIGERLIEKYKDLLERMPDNEYKDQLNDAIETAEENKDFDDIVVFITIIKDAFENIENDFILDNNILEQEETELLKNYNERLDRYWNRKKELKNQQKEILLKMEDMSDKEILKSQKIVDKLKNEIIQLDNDEEEVRNELWNNLTKDLINELNQNISTFEDEEEMINWSDDAINDKIKERIGEIEDDISSDVISWAKHNGHESVLKDYLDIESIAQEYVDNSREMLLSRDDIEGYLDGYYIYKYSD